eukprot:CAMPEP_0202693840 /NCGR_PEP_ID=MMETSP1385-20130828/7860_1 /ASSEMBLY_ACC=CAM_ASM_000861 /TAXON_ID=933848 /ORGANISM="Elphidium margaritaceum" /LENGTH=921 /DNA_ID=CAMNT_0049349587 /DNA_START=41 /DNA_END=2806 /DNA_ORIENTATION=+
MSLAETEEDEERRGKKRNLDELESEASEPPYPKRRKLSFPSPSSQQEKDATPIVLADCNHNNHHNKNHTHEQNGNLQNVIHHDHEAREHAHKIVVDDEARNKSEKKEKDSTPNATRTNCSQNDDNDVAMNNNHNDNCNGEPPPLVPLHASQSSTVSAHSDVDAAAIESSIIQRIDDVDASFDYLSIYTDHRCLIHAIPDAAIIDEFNERPDRLRKLLDMIRAEKWDERCRFVNNVDTIPTLHEIEGLHKMGYLADLKSSCSKIYDKNWHCNHGSDTYLVRQTFEAALISAGLVMDATKHVFSAYLEQHSSDANDAAGDAGDVDAAAADGEAETTAIMDVDDAETHAEEQNKEKEEEEEKKKKKEPSKNYAVVLNRPPGHHADGEKYSGYCYINNTAVAIEKLLNPETRVLVLDIDVHHGDGTQKLFYTEPTVLTVSFHQYDGTFFPVTGARTEYGPSRRHAAYGTNVNVPLARYATDLDVLYSLRTMVWKIVEKFKPDVAFYAVGTDGVANDKANNSTLFSTSLYGQIAYELRSYCDHIIVTTEGGYTTSFLADGMNSVLHGLVGSISTDHYPTDITEDQVLDTTVRTVASTTSDLRRVYDFARDDSEFQRIFKGVNLQKGSADSSFELYKNSKAGESMYIPNDDELDGDYRDDMAMVHNVDDDDDEDEDMGDDDDEFVLRDKKKKKKKKHKDKDKEKDRKKKKKKKHKKDKEKKKEKESNETDFASKRDNDDDNELDENEKLKKDKKSKKKKKKKHKKEKEKDKQAIEVIDLIEDSPNNHVVVVDEQNGHGPSSHKKKKHKDKKKKKKKKDKKHDKVKSTAENMAAAMPANHEEETENISNMTNLDNIFSLSHIIGINGLALNQNQSAHNPLPALSPLHGVHDEHAELAQKIANTNETDRNEIVKEALIGNQANDPIVID